MKSLLLLSTPAVWTSLGVVEAFSVTSKNARVGSVALNAEDAKKRIVVTGLGVVSGCGVGHESFFESCVEGKSSLGPVSRFDASNYPCSIASEISDEMFNPADYFSNVKNVRSNDRYTHLAGKYMLHII